MRDVAAIEAAALDAWPAFEIVAERGWEFRFAEGYTKRANSLNARSPECPLAKILPHAEAFYAMRGRRPIVRVTPLAGDEAILDARDYAVLDQTIVMTAPVHSGPVSPDVHLDFSPTAEWCAGFAEAKGVGAEERRRHDRILALIRPDTAFATVRHDGRAIGFGLGVADGTLLGLFDFVVAPDARGGGAGGNLVRALSAWGASRGATRAYLQVFEDNMGARRLYARHGFADAYRYHYRVGTGS